MKSFLKYFVLALVVLICASAIELSAQRRQRMSESAEAVPAREQTVSVEQEAQLKADKMDKELQLTDRQYRKIQKYYRKDIEYKRELMEDSADGMLSKGRTSEDQLPLPEKYVRKKDRKLRRILSEEQYSKWKSVH